MKLAFLAGIVVLVLIVLLVLLEIGLRWRFGFGNPLTYIADEQVGYLLAPNQQVRRFGHQISINQYSMRSPQISKARSPDTLRILLLGDSIANGGWWTDQDQTIASLLQQQIKPLLQHTSWQQVDVLNASANSWGPRNELAYLQKFGSFEAQVLILLLNTDDLFATAPTSVQVGRDPNYPAHKPPLALVDVLSRFWPAAPIPELAKIQAEGGDRVGINLEAIHQIQHVIHVAHSHFILGMTPLLREVSAPGPRDYELKARQRLQEFTERENILYLDFLPQFTAIANPESLYHDTIHLNQAGNQQVSQSLLKAVTSMLPELHTNAQP